MILAGVQRHMARFQLELAQASDDAALRAVMAATPMAGRLSVCFTREPSFFEAAAIEGRFHQTAVARDLSQEGRVIGLGSRSISPAYVNGEPMPVGYLSSLRLLPEYRGGTLLARAYRFLHHLHADGRARLYVTTIAEGNQPALRALAAGRRELPAYHDAGRYFTMLLPLHRGNSRLPSQAPIDVRIAEASDFELLLEFWNRVGRQWQFFPELSREDFGGEQPAFRDLPWSHLLLAFRGDTLCGTLGLWNQQRFRQTRVTAYSPTLRFARPLLNLVAHFRRQPPLPPLGEPVRYVTAALPVVAQDDSEALAALLDNAQSSPLHPDQRFLAIGMHQQDPLRTVVWQRHTAQYVTRAFIVCWSDGESLRDQLDGRPIYLELGRL
jgi:hypothetical protein